ncbi:MAG: peptidase U32 family protein [Fidelibacterota bacterium]
MKQKSIELLAPAKNLDLGKLAISCGADAVYIGPEKFGARARVGNSVYTIEKLVDFATQYYAKVYVTLNTLLYDEELPNAVALIHDLHKIGVNGIIIQDMGLLECELPPVPIIASTQCFVNTPAKARFFQETGFQRIILPRELSATQIADIRQAAPDIELEYFIHGALCVSYSGQCYMSYALGGRSGNRGVCAQPCRKRYSLYDEKGNLIAENKHLLSLKDLNQSAHLEELIDLGIDSFKIEGRLKDSNYIKNIVTFYRHKIDHIIADGKLTKTSSGTVSAGFQPDPVKTFNRGYTDYFFTGKQADISSIHTPKMRGEYVGKVSSLHKDYFILDSNARLSNGDGITFFKENQLRGTNINIVQKNKIFPGSIQDISVGMSIYRNYDHRFLTSLKNAKVTRKIDIFFKIMQHGKVIILTVTDEDNNHADMTISDFEIARNKEAAKKSLTDSLSKTGNTIFHCRDIQFQVEELPHFKKSQINEIRRDLLAGLLMKRMANRPAKKISIPPNQYPYPIKKLDARGNVINQKAREFYRRHGVQEIEEGIEAQQHIENYTVMTTKYCIRKALGYCPKNTTETSSGNWQLMDSDRNTSTLVFRCDQCEMDVIKETNH